LLKNKKIKGAALDVLQNELSSFFLKKNKLIEYSKKNNNLIITPHIAGWTYESKQKLAQILVQKMIFSLTNY
jgi:D-3-phosphoglycerate dehydrogenase